jgi:hypothetical protein
MGSLHGLIPGLNGTSSLYIAVGTVMPRDLPAHRAHPISNALP